MTTSAAAGMLGVGVSAVQAARKVAEQAPELAEAVRACEMTVNAAARQIAERAPVDAERKARARGSVLVLSRGRRPAAQAGDAKGA